MLDTRNNKYSIIKKFVFSCFSNNKTIIKNKTKPKTSFKIASLRLNSRICMIENFTLNVITFANSTKTILRLPVPLELYILCLQPHFSRK